MQLTGYKLSKCPDGSGSANIVLDNAINIRGVGVVPVIDNKGSRTGNYRIQMPTADGVNGPAVDIDSRSLMLSIRGALIDAMTNLRYNIREQEWLWQDDRFGRSKIPVITDIRIQCLRDALPKKIPRFISVVMNDEVKIKGFHIDDPLAENLHLEFPDKHFEAVVWPRSQQIRSAFFSVIANSLRAMQEHGYQSISLDPRFIDRRLGILKYIPSQDVK